MVNTLEPSALCLALGGREDLTACCTLTSWGILSLLSFRILAKLGNHFTLASRVGKHGLADSGRPRYSGDAPQRAFCSSWQRVLASEPVASQPSISSHILGEKTQTGRN